MLENGRRRGEDHKPVVKLFTPDANFTWLLSEIDPENPRYAFGLCDLGMGFPELGEVYLPEIFGIRGSLGLSIERDRSFVGKFPISVYASAARAKDCITTDEVFLRLTQKAREQ